jgi:aminomuconate-semialdehyde/2-hydroxymuconate-6-semialdehyde dehydrogenase
MDTGHHAYTRFEPAGVVAAVAPWNFPLMLESWKVAPALAWGNTVVLKPAEDTPASAAIMARLALEAGLPPGVTNVLHGYGPNSAGAALTEHPAVDRITFTGESATGRVIARAAAANLVPGSLGLGGKGANIVFDDAALDNAVDWSVKAIFSNAGQVCLPAPACTSSAASTTSSSAASPPPPRALVVGDPKDPATQLGPLASQEHWKKVRSFLDSIEPDGGTIRTGGPGEGWVVLPTIVENAPPAARVRREEVFGPVVTVTPFDTDDEAVAQANDTPYGLNAMIFTENLSRAHRASAALKAGTVWINCFFIRDLRAPFGGVGDSGTGREFFTEPKAVVMQM